MKNTALTNTDRERIRAAVAKRYPEYASYHVLGTGFVPLTAGECWRYIDLVHHTNSEVKITVHVCVKPAPPVVELATPRFSGWTVEEIMERIVRKYPDFAGYTLTAVHDANHWPVNVHGESFYKLTLPKGYALTVLEHHKYGTHALFIKLRVRIP